jgi:hypothetical protein
MIVIDIEATFAKFEDEYMNFDLIEQKLHHRPDICAFILIDRLCGGSGDVISAAGHDQIWLDADLRKLSRTASEEDIQTLRRCGVMYDEEFDCLTMFV